MTNPRRLLLLCVIALCLGGLADADSAFRGWRSETTEHFRFIYEPRDRGVVSALLEYAEEVYDLLDPYLPYDPDRVTVVIRGRSDLANGYMTFGPPHISIFVASPTNQYLGARTGSWIRAVFTHELAHYLHLTEPTGVFGVLGRVFGDQLARWNVLLLPGWMIEGITTNVETLLTNGGRGRDPFFELKYKALVVEGEMFDYTQAGYASAFPPSGRIYVAGYILVDHILRTYGASAFHEIYTRFAGWPVFPVGMRGAIRRVTGLSPKELFAEMVSELRAGFDETARFPQGERWSPAEIGDWYLPIPTEAGIFAYRKTLEYGPAVVRLPGDEGGASEDRRESVGGESRGRSSPRVVLSGALTDAYSFSVDHSGRYLAATSVEFSTTHSSGADWVNRSVLTIVDLETGATRRIPGLGGVYHPALEPGGNRVVLVQRVGSYSRLVRYDLLTGDLAVLYEEPGLRVYNPVVSADGRLVAFVRNLRGVQDIAVLSDGGVTVLTDAAEVGRAAGWPNRAAVATQPATGSPASESPSEGARSAEYFPRWDGPDHLVYSSDRDGFLALYRTDVTSGETRLLVRDRVGATAGVRVAADAARGGESGVGVGYLYQSYSPDGWILRTAPEPDRSGASFGLELIDIGVGELGASDSPVRAEPEELAETTGGSASRVLRGAVHRGRSVFHSWLPVAWTPSSWSESFGSAPLGVGATVYGANYLGTRSVVAQLGFVPSIAQPFGVLHLSRDFGELSAQAQVRYEPDAFPGTLLTLPAFTTRLSGTLEIVPTLFESITRLRSLRVVGFSGVAAELRRISPEPHPIGQPPNDAFYFRSLGAFAGSQIAAFERGLPPLALYGGTGAAAGLQGQIWPEILDVPATELVVLGFGYGALRTMRSQRLAVDTSLAWGFGRSPAGVLSYRGNATWEPLSASSASLRGLLTVDYEIPIALLDVPFLGLGITSLGASLFAQTGASAGGLIGGVNLDDFVVVGAQFEAGVRAGNLPLPLSVGVAARIPYDRGFSPGDDLSVIVDALVISVVVQTGGCLTPTGAGCTFQSSSWTSQRSSRSLSTTLLGARSSFSSPSPPASSGSTFVGPPSTAIPTSATRGRR